MRCVGVQKATCAATGVEHTLPLPVTVESTAAWRQEWDPKSACQVHHAIPDDGAWLPEQALSETLAGAAWLSCIWPTLWYLGFRSGKAYTWSTARPATYSQSAPV